MQENVIFSRLCNFLLNGVTKEGGWDSEPGTNKETNPLNTAEALCGLISARARMFLRNANYDETIEKAVKYLCEKQLPSGGWTTGSSYKSGEDISKLNGDIVSTSFSLWALMLYRDKINHSFEINEIIKKALGFFESCNNQNNHLYKYNPTLSDTESVIPTAYVFLAFALISVYNNNNSFLDKNSKLILDGYIKDVFGIICDEEFEKKSKNSHICIVKVYISILLCGKIGTFSQNVNLKKAKKKYKEMVENLTLEQCKENFKEEQAVRNSGKQPRDFIHLVPSWILILCSLCDESDVSLKYKKLVLNSVLGKIDDDGGATHDGRGKGKRTTWATGLTLFSLSLFANNFNFDEIVKMEGISMTATNNKVFVVHGRDMDFRKNIFNLLRATELQPLEWEVVVKETGKASPSTFEVLTKGFEMAQAVVVLFTADDEGKLKENFVKNNDPVFEKELTGQPRMNVIFEAGLAYGINPSRTVILRRPEVLREMSDVSGINYITYSENSESRHRLIERLKTAGCNPITSGTDWLNA